MMRQISILPTFSAWQTAARQALAGELPPGEIAWEEIGEAQPALAMFEEHIAPSSPASRHRVPRQFLEIAERVACHRGAQRWAVLYSALWRLTHGEPRLLDIVVDPVVDELLRMDKAVRHDLHKMRAFVRFRAVSHGGSEWYVAWFEPEHHIVELNAPFFRDRFASMHWSILTPDRCVHWDGTDLTFTIGVPRSEAPTDDAVEGLWLSYYAHVFNPARVKTQKMEAEMPKRYWKNLPEAAIIPTMLREAPQRVERMLEESAGKAIHDDDYGIAQPPVTDDFGILREAALQCRACPLWKNATQTVFGEGPLDARLVFVGEQPGDSEDLAGQPFVGPAGQLFDRALADAGIDRSKAFVTNAVKHFKWEPRGKRRLHQTPSPRDIAACRPWLTAELRLLSPAVLVCLGGTAAKSIVGADARVLRDRGQVKATELCRQTIITVHPSSLLRAPTEEARASQYALFVQDLATAAALARAAE